MSIIVHGIAFVTVFVSMIIAVVINRVTYYPIITSIRNFFNRLFLNKKVNIKEEGVAKNKNDKGLSESRG